MALQYNMGPGQPMYAPHRDIAYLYPSLVEQVERRLYEGPFEPLSKWLDEEGVTYSELAHTVKVYCLFLNAAHKNPDQSVEQCLESVGWFECPGPARAALMFYLGAALTGSFFQAIRDVTKMGEDPGHVPALVATSNRVATYMNAGPIRRWWLRRYYRWFKSPNPPPR